ncbi:MAG: hypothetical protein ACI915_005363 [Gammaproteobacteria bacterium]|jgi:hypothetical protein
MWKYLRFAYIHWTWIPLTIVGFLLGGWWVWTGFVYLFVVGVGGEILTRQSRDETTPHYSYPIIHDMIIYSVVISHGLALFVAAWACSGGDVLGFGVLTNSLFSAFGAGIDVFAARDANVWFDYVGIGMSLGGVLGVSGIGAAHELTHRTTRPLDLWFGRWDFALMFGTNFATEHVFGHHKNLGYAGVDTVSPKRGVGFYEFLTAGGWAQWKGGYDIERARLDKLGKHWFSPANRVLHAWLRGALVVLVVCLIGGWLGLCVWLIAAAFAKYILEGLNFFSHYGLLRLEGEKVTTRNTFSSFNPLSNHFTFNLGRHGSHHEYDRPYYKHEYKAMPESPFGYLTMTLVSWFPPIFWKLMIPMLKDWDDKWATPAELQIIDQHNRDSGREELAPQQAASQFAA